VVAEVQGFHKMALISVSSMLVSQKNVGWVLRIVRTGTRIGTRHPSGNALISSGK
jgi:hypothetical protein